MKRQIMFSRKNKKNIIHLSSAVLAQTDRKIRMCDFFYLFYFISFLFNLFIYFFIYFFAEAFDKRTTQILTNKTLWL